MKYAIALEGGGARGAFEVGVLKALKKNNIEVEAIAGTSIGAINGAAFASEVDLEGLWLSLDIKKIFPSVCENVLSFKSIIMSIKQLCLGGLDTTKLKLLLSKYISESKVRASGIDFGLCTYSCSKKSICEFFLNCIPNGSLIDYILASACFPVFKPAHINGEEFSDGGIQNNLPVDMLISRGYENIIAVSVCGIGIKKHININKINYIEITPKKPLCGIMDFSAFSIKKSIYEGYKAVNQLLYY